MSESRKDAAKWVAIGLTFLLAFGTLASERGQALAEVSDLRERVKVVEEFVSSANDRLARIEEKLDEALRHINESEDK